MRGLPRRVPTCRRSASSRPLSWRHPLIRLEPHILALLYVHLLRIELARPQILLQLNLRHISWLLSAQNGQITESRGIARQVVVLLILNVVEDLLFPLQLYLVFIALFLLCEGLLILIDLILQPLQPILIIIVRSKCLIAHGTILRQVHGIYVILHYFEINHQILQRLLGFLQQPGDLLQHILPILHIHFEVIKLT